MDDILNETMASLRGGSIEAPWWQNVLHRIGQKYIAPDFLTKPALQEWLSEERVADDLKVLARARIMGSVIDNEETRTRLVRSYSDRTGEADQYAKAPIDVSVAILVAGYIASIPSDQLPIAGMFQELFGQFNERFDHMEETRLSALTDPITQQAHTAQAEQELRQILSTRVFDLLGLRRKIQELLNRMTVSDLAAANCPIKAKVTYWTARLCAGDTETLELARQLRNKLQQTDLAMDLTIVDALLAEADGNEDEALRLLRDHDDPDSRTTLFGVLARSQSESAALDWFEQQDTRSDSQCFTPVGWINWAICMSKLGKWKEASQRLMKFEALWPGMPALAFVEGRINAAMLLPDDFRQMVFDDVPFCHGISPRQGTEAAQHHARAIICFEFAEQKLQTIVDRRLMKVIADWRLWLRLMDPSTATVTVVRDEIRQDMEKGARAVELIPFAYAFNIPFNVEPLRRHLEQRKQFGGLNDRELLAECLLYQQSMSPGAFSTYLEQQKGRLIEVMPLAFVTTMHVAALVSDNQTERARALVTEHSADLDGAHSNRMTMAIDAHEGNDPRKDLEKLYHQTGNIVDLRNLASYLKTVDDREALRPLARKLFEHDPTVENAHDVVKCLGIPPFFDQQAIIEFLEAYPDILGQSDDLKAEKAWALFHMGRFAESKKINDEVLTQRTNQNDLHLDINLAVFSGDWERLGATVAREWPRRDTHDSETLMSLARLVGQQGQAPDRALRLARLATEKAPDDPRILAAAYWLHLRLGRDGEADPDWLARATEFSSTDEGPLWRVDLRDVVVQWLPKRQEHLREVERKWLSGEIPMGLAAGRFNVSLARLLLHLPGRNTRESDGRRRMVLPIIAGGRSPIELQASWTIGLDVTSIMVLAYLGLLEQAISAFHHVKLAPDVMECLFRERDEASFHQPSRIEAAKRIGELESRGQLRAADILTKPPKDITDEVGLELATLLEMARHDTGKVICVLPIHRAGTLMEQQADTSAHDDLILSAMDVCTWLRDEGKIDTTDHRHASLFLESQGQTARAKLTCSILNGPVYVDGLALSYLQDANILQLMAAAGLDIRIHSDLLDEIHGLVEEGDAVDSLVEKIEGIRDVLRNALESGTASFLPRASDQDKPIQKHEIGFQATASLLVGSAGCDVLCIDDRYINSRSVFTEPTGRCVPIVCVLDVLHYLHRRGCIGIADHWSVRHKLRDGGFAFIPLESDELVHWLKAARVNNSYLVEGAELRILRQTMHRTDAPHLTNPGEAFTLTANIMTTCRQAVAELWEDNNLPAEKATALSDLVWRNLTEMLILGRQHFEQHRDYTNWTRETISRRLGSLFLPKVIQSQNRRTHYGDWIEQSVLQPLRPANSGMINKALTLVREAISALEDEQQAYGTLFLEQLPEAARRVVMTQDAEFSSRCGFETRPVFSIGPDVNLTSAGLFAAAREVLATNEEKSVQDVDGKEVSIGFEADSQNMIMKWSDAEGVSRQRQIPDLTLLSPNREARLTTLRNIIDRLGPTVTDFEYLLADIESRQLSYQELSAIFDESANGVAAFQINLIHRIEHGCPVSIADVIPQSIFYFERFTGPNPDGREPETYFTEVLVPYRKALLNRKVHAGLDICCLGAVRDDLTPGQWVAAIDDDAVWDALHSCHAKSNPFSLLGALDVALYRQEDPRFREFAAEAVAKLSDDSFDQRDGSDMYRLLPVFAHFMLNRINLLENGALYPGYWKRMGAWMQGGIVARALVESSSSIDIGALEEWTGENMQMAGAYAELVDARNEPMLLAGRIPTQDLRHEILGRLRILRTRHENEGREVPRAEDISRALARTEERGQALALAFPGPLEGHRRPTEPTPRALTEELREAWTESPELFPTLAMAAQFFALGEPELELAREAVERMAEDDCDADLRDNLTCLELASIVAAANRDETLADGIADAVVRVVPGISNEEEIQIVLRIVLQAAAAYELQDVWFKWLEERLASIAAGLPSPPNEALQTFLGHLGEIQIVLSVDSWFHIRAKSMALAGAA